MKTVNRIFILYISVAMLMFSCESSEDTKKSHTIEGATQGTTYKITYLSEKRVVSKSTIDEVFEQFSFSLSTYIDTSLISRINHSQDTLFEIDEYFYEVFRISEEIFLLADGAFNPAVMPLVHFWGFGVRKNLDRDTTLLDSLRKLVSFESFSVFEADKKYFLRKSIGLAQLDFNAVAQGYSADVIGFFLEQNKITNYMVEVGGEVRCRGINPKGEFWNIGIDRPVASEAHNRKLKAIISLDNHSLATSGNYRKFREQEGMKYGHTINPATGYPEVNNTLSVTVITSDCAKADALATAFMVMGYEKAYEWATNADDVEAYFIYSDSAGNMLNKQTEGLNKWLREL